MKSVLVISSFEKGRGSGHLVRSCSLVFNLQNKLINAQLYIPSLGTKCGRSLKEAQDIFEQCGIDPAAVNLILDKDKISKQEWNIVVTDMFRMESGIFYFLKNIAPVLAIDEGGCFRSSADFLLDILPVYSNVQPNFLRCNLLQMPKPENRKQKKFSVENSKPKILISFGSEDTADLGKTVASALAICDQVDVTLVSGILYDDAKKLTVNSNCVRQILKIENMREHLAEYDLLITHFGLSAFEALCAGTLVILVAPTRLHKKTAQMAGFFSAGFGKKGALKIPRLLFNHTNFIGHTKFIESLSKRCAELEKKYNLEAQNTLADFIQQLEPQSPSVCPVCGSTKENKTIARFSGRTYKLCEVCSMYYLLRITPPDIEYSEYNEKYFFENYKKQYGKTYLEDFASLIAMAKKRLFHIHKIVERSDAKNTSGKTLLDIGCAYGAFLSAAQEEGFIPHGADISDAAVAYVNGTLHIHAEKCDFEYEDTDAVRKFYDVITLWYVVEHFQNLKAALLKIKSILQDGGVLAFSTPSAAGISARKSIKNFLKQSPEDHRTVLNPHKIKQLLKVFGFDVQKIVITGHHPERFPIIGKYLHPSTTKKTGKILYRIIFLISRFFRLGDTFEVYAVKQTDSESKST
ncbi:MAG: hypothetical protein Ta2F_05550 [Termitinemataceae bacterium]|nr:MAG: hypothetical protein Ta2F_05550 [Termitinemataceae bacterium]